MPIKEFTFSSEELAESIELFHECKDDALVSKGGLSQLLSQQGFDFSMKYTQIQQGSIL